MVPKIVLITGGNRGIGRGFVELYLARPNHTIIVANRDPEHPTSKSLADLPKAEGTKLLVVKNDATVPTDAADMVRHLASLGIDHLDIVLANAGVCKLWCKVSEVTAEQIQDHVTPNIFGFIWLYQATLPLLKKASKPMWVTNGSSAAFLTVSSSSEPYLAIEVTGY